MNECLNVVSFFHIFSETVNGSDSSTDSVESK